MSPPLTIDELLVADPSEAWRAAGFEVEGDLCVVGAVRLRLGNAGRGIVGWSVRGTATLDLDGLPTTASTDPPPPPASAEPHPNGTIAIDHVVAFTPDLDRTTATLRATGLDLRRIREEPTPGGAPRQRSSAWAT